MRINRIEAYYVDIPYLEPFRIALGTSRMSRNIVLKIYTDEDYRGLGEACPSRRITFDTLESSIEALEKLSSKILGKDPFRIEVFQEIYGSVRGNTSIKAAIDMAIYDLIGKYCGKPVYKIFGGYRDEIETDVTIGIKSPHEMAESAKKWVKKGFRKIKIKVGINPAEDIERIRMVREAIGDNVELRIDANQGWSVEDAIKVLNKVEKYDIKFCEQPVLYTDIDGLKKVKENSPIPIMADESVHNSRDALKVIEKDAVDLINIKLMKSGGINEAMRIAHMCEAAGVPNMIGCMGESKIGITAAVHTALAFKNIIYYDLDSDLLHREDVVLEGGASIDNGVRRIPTDIAGYGIHRLRIKMLHPIKIWRL
ncbi:MAG: dipeptide epimerase [Thermoprotei archaeon]|nr:MAG: dipeptide epimerase [Thermoprotei archaeon]